MKNENTIEYQVWFRDIDPDSGDVSNEMMVAKCTEEFHANWVRHSLEYNWFSPEGPNEPNREFVIKKIVADV